jgi:hypothetical protein
MLLLRSMVHRHARPIGFSQSKVEIVISLASRQVCPVPSQSCDVMHDFFQWIYLPCYFICISGLGFVFLDFGSCFLVIPFLSLCFWQLFMQLSDLLNVLNWLASHFDHEHDF